MSKDLEHPFVSICIPVFNGENYISEAINSVLTQSYTNFELIIVDNCSTDSTEKIVCEFNDKRIKYKKNEINIGSIKNFNKCIEVASGEYFLLLPHDDLLLPEALRIFVDRLSDQEIGFVYSSIITIDEGGNEFGRKVNHIEDQVFTWQETVADIVNFFVPIQLAMTRTIVLKDLGGFDSKFGLFADIHLWLRITFKGWKAFYNHETLSCHRVHSEQGQKSFLELDISTVSEHWGEKLDTEFWKNNSYNTFLVKLMRFIEGNLVDKQINTTQIKNLLLQIFIHSHLRFLILSVIRLNKFILWQEILLFSSVMKSYGVLKMGYYYPLIFLQIIRDRIVYKSKNFIKSFSQN